MTMESLIGQDTISIDRPAVVSDDAGGFDPLLWARVATGIAARVDVSSGSQKMMFAQLQIEVSHTVYTQYTGIINGDRITSSDGKMMRVVGVTRRNGFGGIAGYVELPCVEILT